MSENVGGNPPDPELGGILDLVARKVRVRFPLSAVAFADRLLDLAGAALPRAEGALARVENLRLDDLYLATACSRGLETAWEECAARHFGFIRDFARRYVREPEASDLADQVIADLWQRGKIARFDGRSSLRTWLAAVVAHAALNALNASRRGVSLESEEFQSWRRRHERLGAGDASDRQARDVLGQLVTEALRGMPNDARLLILLHYEQGLTLDEMSLVLRASKSTLSRRLKRACADLRASVDAAARARFGRSADYLRDGIDLTRLDLDLSGLMMARAGSGRTGDEPV